MDYEEALHRLDSPVKKDSKRLNRLLGLRKLKSAEPAETALERTNALIALRYFNTDILIWSADGTVHIDDGGFLSASCTRNMINEYLPRGWKLWTYPLASDPKKFIATVGDRFWDVADWKTTFAFPYSPKARYSPKSASHTFEAHQHNATELMIGVAKYTKQCVQEFVNGRLLSSDVQQNIFEDFLESWHTGNTEKQEKLALATVLGQQVHPATFVKVISNELARGWPTVSKLSSMNSYWSEYFEYTTAKKSRNKKELAKRIEFEMRHPDKLARWKRNSTEFRFFRNLFEYQGEQLLLEALGFKIYDKESFPRTSR